MSFQESLAEFTAAQIIAATGCPRATAYCWLDGSRKPPVWQQAHWLALVRAHTVKTAKPEQNVEDDA